MRISQAQPNEVEALDDYDKIEYGVDLEDMGMMYQAFLNYSDPISTIVREITSNCFDSHIEAGVDKNIEIEIKNKNYLTGQAASIHFRDFGVGLSPERIKTVYSKFFKSTKRDTDNEIGGFGQLGPAS